MKDIEKLSLCSEMAGKYGGNYEIIEIEEYHKHQEDELSFHPNGKCGCILLDDDYAFGIRCNHLMWAEGWCEGIEYFWTKDDHAKQNYNVILVYGNHKGELHTSLLVFHELKEK